VSDLTPAVRRVIEETKSTKGNMSTLIEERIQDHEIVSRAEWLVA
jgi:hypothetical protein